MTGPSYLKYPINLLYWLVLVKEYNLLEWSDRSLGTAMENISACKEMISFIRLYSMENNKK